MGLRNTRDCEQRKQAALGLGRDGLTSFVEVDVVVWVDHVLTGPYARLASRGSPGMEPLRQHSDRAGKQGKAARWPLHFPWSNALRPQLGMLVGRPASYPNASPRFAARGRLGDTMDEETLRRVVKEEVQAVREEVRSVREEIRASEARLGEAGRLQFRQLAELYRSTLEKVEHLERHLGERIDATRGSIEALRSSLERQDFRADELGRRLARLETRTDQ